MVGMNSTGPVIISAFYKFVELPDYRERRAAILAEAEAAGVKGSILLASEGINGTISGSREGSDVFFAWLRSQPRFANLETKESFADEQVFRRTKVLLKSQIVTFREKVDPNDKVGAYVDPRDWNALIGDPSVLVIDTRNSEEFEIGSFAKAINPNTQSFTEFADFVDNELDPEKHTRVAMFCTGGIRCEKASSYLLEKGFPEVSHLRGGILKYLEEVPEDASLWRGECFVFDERVSVDHDLAPGSFTVCRGCRGTLAPADREAPEFEEGVSCARCFADLTPARAARFRERHKQQRLAESRGALHLGQRLRGASEPES